MDEEGIEFEDLGGSPPKSYSQTVTESNLGTDAGEKPTYPKAMIALSEQKQEAFLNWIDWWMTSLDSSIQDKITQWTQEEKDYRAVSLGPQITPYIGACGDVVPAIAMAVDPIHARLDTGIFKSDPVFRLKGLKKSMLSKIDSVERFIEFYQKHKLKLRQVSSPRLLECTKHGTMIFKTVYSKEVYKVKSYDQDWKVVKREHVRYAGPKVTGVNLQDFWFPPRYQFLQDCPIVAERQRPFYSDLKIAEASGLLVNCDKIETFYQNGQTSLDTEQQVSSQHKDAGSWVNQQLEVFEIWCRFDIDGDGLPESLVATYHRDSRTLLQLRYNYYFHQRYPFTVIPYSITNNSLYGIGIAEMTKPFQDMLTKWQRMATDNAYLANIRMFIGKKDSGLEESPKLFGGKTFLVDDPSKDFRQLEINDTYPSTTAERQNLFGLAEKRTGVSDYLTGRESPIVGSRATATSTMALIQEGTRRVEEVLENIRVGMADIMEMCLSIWQQFGLDGIDDIVFGGDQVATDVKDFFDMINQDNVNGSIAIDLSATDAANNKSAQQQMQLSIIQTMMQYLEKLLSAGAQAIQAQQTMPEYTAMVGEVMTAARKMFKDLLQKYDVTNPEDYLPDLEKFLATANGQGAPGGAAVGVSPLNASAGIPAGDGSGGLPPTAGSPTAPGSLNAGGIVPPTGTS